MVKKKNYKKFIKLKKYMSLPKRSTCANTLHFFQLHQHNNFPLFSCATKFKGNILKKKLK